MGDRCLACHADVATQAATRDGPARPARRLRGNVPALPHGPSRRDRLGHARRPARLPARPDRLRPDGARARRPSRTAIGCRDCHPASPQRLQGARLPGLPPAGSTQRRWPRTPTRTVRHCLNCHDGKDSYGHAFAHTAYPLTGKHAAADCASCHQGSTTLAALRTTSTACASCHGKDDIHQGRLGHVLRHLPHARRLERRPARPHDADDLPAHGQARRRGVRVVPCQPAVDGDRHDLRRLPREGRPPPGQVRQRLRQLPQPVGLEGGHVRPLDDRVRAHAGACQRGLREVPPGRQVRRDAHQLRGLPRRHRTSTTARWAPTARRATSRRSWSAASFDHSTTSFKLTGAHVGVGCAAVPRRAARRRRRPRPVRRATPSPPSHDSHFAGSCAACHTTKAWRPASFDHKTTSYKLIGAHLSVSCSKCHARPVRHVRGRAQPSAPRATTNPPITPGRCGPTAGPATPPGRGRRPRSTTARRRSSSPAPTIPCCCQKCHKGSSFAGLPTTCIGCHNKPSSHPGFYPTACTRATRRRPGSRSRTTGPTRSLMSHRGAGGICTKCHTTSLQSYTCARCHSDSSMTSKHHGGLGLLPDDVREVPPDGQGWGLEAPDADRRGPRRPRFASTRQAGAERRSRDAEQHVRSASGGGEARMWASQGGTPAAGAGSGDRGGRQLVRLTADPGTRNEPVRKRPRPMAGVSLRVWRRRRSG